MRDPGQLLSIKVDAQRVWQVSIAVTLFFVGDTDITNRCNHSVLTSVHPNFHSVCRTFGHISEMAAVKPSLIELDLVVQEVG